ncbi:bifunctional diaminohydroxyphosphoribosylaminopyrimidine deaminase/5-amino-6-(5-phosphoribosylamino)uracil reductase RibD [Prevotella denticola]|uniref:bifunctional diaminohydroxyphosphoribosylaminopyrimidine deaminase/5-amino-6-(5-phosphoribosylamino)uracil reductase RibD n=1 Tax=Prevotella denticola TaxID=28129 RepID=UPI001C5FB22F|nr:bifunctional diaminohydroxyphosphoribosylaminopyrimidine deaminase/5-amino-6-(5-phosphoribosylamino)uracil reductase RibD [Prevotella denticola]MBW4713965.1 bifunctional diaminohydroxyphosphoribosylaminopyrimidine deaminase/5-amino-6-(5-phosphoribosylamino)uracil reductase RibD [Prevotella denticola]MBW4751874.1 bifunctional diaminohydroxyphosphoribosylaminopyrimidine deaminase/5-amino-6-(5-phosphoribosylamino)uracil reductase RibD [Prevotella denticola]
MKQEETDEIYMHRCLQLARNGQQLAKPNPMVGAVIVSKDGRIIGEGYHVRCGEGHAEVNAFASVRKEDEALLHEATVYVSLEPCSHYGKTPPCADLIINKGVRRVVCGCIDPFSKVQGRGVKKLREAGIDVTVGVLEKECLELNKRFITYNTHHRPYVILKWAQTKRVTTNTLFNTPTNALSKTPASPSPSPLPHREGSEHRDSPDDLSIINGSQDEITAREKKTSVGYIGNLPGKDYHPLIISTPFTKMLVHKLRAENDAILVGKTTEELEHPQLTVREWSGPNPEKLVLTSHPTREGEYATPAEALAHLYEEKKQSLVVEGGAKTLQSFLDAGLWDEIRIETAPFTVDKGIEAPKLPGNLRITKVEKYVNTIVTYEREQDETGL